MASDGVAVTVLCGGARQLDVLDVTTLGPLGRRAAALGSDSPALAAADLTLVHPARLVPFADDPAKFWPGELRELRARRRVVLMGAQRGLETLETHPQNVMGSEGLARGTAGCLVVYCAGCALKIEARLQRVAEAFSYSLERPSSALGSQCLPNRHCGYRAGYRAGSPVEEASGRPVALQAWLVDHLGRPAHSTRRCVRGRVEVGGGVLITLKKGLDARRNGLHVRLHRPPPRPWVLSDG